MAVVVLIAGGRYGWSQLAGQENADDPLTVPVGRGTLRVTVSERGNLESVKTVDGICEVSGFQNKIIFIVPEGDAVKAGDVVVRFDSAEVDQKIAQQEIKVKQAEVKVKTTEQEMKVKENEGDSAIAEAELEYKLAKLDLEKYRDGDSKVEESDLKGLIELSEADLAEAEEELEVTKKLVKKGFRTPAQQRRSERILAQRRFYLERDQAKLEVHEKHDVPKNLVEKQAKLDQAKSKRERAEATKAAEVAKATSEYETAKSTLQLETQQLETLMKEKDKHVITATQGGIVAYANQPYYDSSRQIREGAIVYSRQKIFSLPDMSEMQVKVNVHESMVKKVKAGQKAQIRVESFPNARLLGTVTRVSPLADSTQSWMRGGVKEYTTIVTIDTMPEEELKPGMTAEVQIAVNELSGVLNVPVQAVTEHLGKHYVYVKSQSGIERREVKIGESNQKFVETTDGLSEGEEVALDARQRGIDDFKNESDDSTPAESPEQQASSSSPTSPGT